MKTAIRNNSEGAQPELEFDVAIIGAGISGMTAGALLAKSGLRVMIVEEQAKPGGYLMGFSRKGFTFDSSIQWLNQCTDGGLVHWIFNYIGHDYPHCKDMKRIRRYRGDTFDYLLTSDPYQFRDALIRDFPDDGPGISRFFDDCSKLGKHFGIMNSRMRAIETMGFMEKIVFGIKMLAWYVPARKFIRWSAEEGLEKYFRNAGLKKIFSSEEKFMSVIMPICWAFAGDFQTPPEGGAEVFIKWLRQKIEKLGSKILLNTSAERIIVENSVASGLILSSGQAIRAKYVVAASDVENLYERMLPQGLVPEKLKKTLREADLYYSSVTLFIGLDCESSVLGFGEEMTCITSSNISRAEHSSGDPHKNSLIVQAPSVRDSSLAPAGKSTLTIHCVAWLDYAEFWKTGEGLTRGEEYREFKREFADVLIHRVETAMGVDIRKHMEVLEIATPVTYWRYTKNRAGSIMGANPTDKNIKNRIAHYRTPVKNLFLAGHWAEYGGGVPMAVKAAANVSLLILKKNNKKEFKKLCSVMDGKYLQ